jgi:hypothetical protein
VLEPTQLPNSIQYGAVKKKIGNEYQWFLFIKDDYFKISKAQVFSLYLPTVLFYKLKNKNRPPTPENKED